MQKGWEEYDRKFDDHLKKWMASELTQEQLAQQVMATAAALRTQSGGRWTLEVKAKIPELLAGIFALYSILRSGKAYSSVLAGTTADPEETSDAVKPQESGFEQIIADIRLLQALYFLLPFSRHVDKSGCEGLGLMLTVFLFPTTGESINHMDQEPGWT